jgi:hypothetical protein
VNDTGLRVERILSTLNAADVGSLESIAEKMLQVEGELLGLGRDELAGRAREAVAALRRGDVAEFQRARAFLQSKVGHLRP